MKRHEHYREAEKLLGEMNTAADMTNKLFMLELAKVHALLACSKGGELTATDPVNPDNGEK